MQQSTDTTVEEAAAEMLKNGKATPLHMCPVHETSGVLLALHVRGR